MTRTTQIVEFVRANPGATNRQIAAGVGIKDATQAATRTKLLMDKGFITRTVVGKTLTNVEIYGYTFVKNAARRVPGRRPSSHKQKMEQRGGSIDTLIDQLASAMADAFVSRVTEHLKVELTRILPANIPVQALPVFTARDQIEQHEQVRKVNAGKLKILVVNIAPSGCEEVKRDFRDVADIECWTVTADGEHRLKQAAKAADHVFFNLSLSSHKHEAMLKTAGCEYTKVKGGTSAMKTAITQWLVNKEVIL